MDENPMTPAGWATIQSFLPKNWTQRAEELRLCRSIRSATGEEKAKLRDPEKKRPSIDTILNLPVLGN